MYALSIKSGNSKRTILSLIIKCGGVCSTTTLRATNSSVLARDRRKSPGCTSQPGRPSMPSGKALFSSGLNTPQDTALTFRTPQFVPSLDTDSHCGLHPESLVRATFPKRTHDHDMGIS